MAELSFNVDHGYLEGLVRGMKAGILTASDYHNLAQCDTLQGKNILVLYTFSSIYKWITIYKVCKISFKKILFTSCEVLSPLRSCFFFPLAWLLRGPTSFITKLLHLNWPSDLISDHVLPGHYWKSQHHFTSLLSNTYCPPNEGCQTYDPRTKTGPLGTSIRPAWWMLK